MFALVGRDFEVLGRTLLWDDGRFVVLVGLLYVFDFGLVEECREPPFMERLPVLLLACCAPPPLCPPPCFILCACKSLAIKHVEKIMAKPMQLNFFINITSVPWFSIQCFLN